MPDSGRTGNRAELGRPGMAWRMSKVMRRLVTWACTGIVCHGESSTNFVSIPADGVPALEGAGASASQAGVPDVAGGGDPAGAVQGASCLALACMQAHIMCRTTFCHSGSFQTIPAVGTGDCGAGGQGTEELGPASRGSRVLSLLALLPASSMCLRMPHIHKDNEQLCPWDTSRAAGQRGQGP